MIRPFVILVAVGTTLVAQAERYAPLLDGLESGRGAPPSLEEILLDVAMLVRNADKHDAAVLERRLREVQDELRLLERLQRTLKGGVLIKIPESLLPRLGTRPDAAELAQEKERLQKLQAEYALRRHRKTPTPAIEPSLGELARSGRASPFGSAALDVQIEVPEPPRTRAGTPDAVKRAVDPVGLAKALYRAGDFAGALNAIESIAEGERTNEVMYRRARCLERLGRHEDAGTQYRAVVAADATGFWGKQAQWMLRFGQKKFGTMDLMTRTAKDAERKGKE